METSDTYKKMSRPPKWALRKIVAGRLKGKTDINPQWRYQIMTETFGPIGIGWGYDITRMWMEPGANGEIAAFATIGLWIKDGDNKSEPIPGIGGSMFVANEKNGPYVSDEAYKMAVTDALSVAMKSLGVASDIYAGAWDGSKYAERNAEPEEPEYITPEQSVDLQAFLDDIGDDGLEGKLLEWLKVDSIGDMTQAQYASAMKKLEVTRKAKEERG